MKVKFYLLPLILFLFKNATAQDCSALNFTYTTAESRCVATGSITVNATGGSGNYTYKATGPIAPPSTSSNAITGLPPGYYSVVVRDMTTGCSRQIEQMPAVPATTEPSRPPMCSMAVLLSRIPLSHLRLQLLALPIPPVIFPT
jgi:hypothetical protein